MSHSITSDKPIIIKHNRKSKLVSLLIIMAISFILFWGVYTVPSEKNAIELCPVKAFTGYSCFGCGLGRSIVYALHSDFDSAFRMHPLWVVFLPLLILILLYHISALIINKRFNINHPVIRRVNESFLVILALLIIGLGIIRLVTNQTI